MISEKDKQAILNGSYGVNRRGNKVKYLFTSNLNDDSKAYLFVEYTQCHNTYWTNENFSFYNISEHSADIIGLWKNKDEIFDLKKVLSGKPIKNHAGLKTFIIADARENAPNERMPFIGYVVKRDGTANSFHCDLSYLESCTMWVD